jgi:hypothetical protein
MSSRQILLDNLSTFLGAEAMVRCGQRVFRARIEDIKTTDSGITVDWRLIPTRGLNNDRPDDNGFYSAWSAFGCSPRSWAAPYISIAVYFEPGLIAHVFQRCAEADSDQYNKRRFWEISDWMKEYRTATREQSSPD